VLDVIDGMFRFIFDGITVRCTAELAAINAQFPFTPLRYRKDKSCVARCRRVEWRH
jgi:hypothetical protein